MKKLLIADCWLLIENSFLRRRFVRSSHDRGQIIGFLQKRSQSCRREHAGFDQQFEPQGGFISLFLDRPHLGDKFSAAASPATCAVIRRDRSATADNLPGDDTPGVVASRNGFCQFDDAECKCFGACFEFGWIHGAKVQIQSATSNQQSAIEE